MDFYRVEITEMNNEGVSVLVCYCLPSALECLQRIFKQYKDRYDLSEPKFVQVPEPLCPVKGFMIEGERNPYFFFSGDL